MEYTFTQILHLLCAALFMGVVFFEVFILEGIRKRTPAEVMDEVETNLVARAKFIMPWVVGVLFLSGIMLAYHHFRNMSDPLSSSFHVLLMVKIAVAISVLVHFVTAIRSSVDGCMNSRRFEYTHLSVAIHMVVIVLLAKLMFVVHW